MFMQVFIKCGRRLHHEESYVKYFHENSSTEWSDRRSVPRSMWVLRSGYECLLSAVPPGGGTPSVADFCVHRRHVNFRSGGRTTRGCCGCPFLPQLCDDILRRKQVLESLRTAGREFRNRLADCGWIKCGHRRREHSGTDRESAGDVAGVGGSSGAT